MQAEASTSRGGRSTGAGDAGCSSGSASFERWRSACASVLSPPSPLARSCQARRVPIKMPAVRSVVEGPETPAGLAEWVEGHEETEEERVARDRCERWKDELLRTSPMIRFMVKQLALVSCDPLEAQSDARAPPKLEIASCPPTIAGGFTYSDPGRPTSESGVMVCANRIMDKKHLEETLSHEMIHWWDHCRFKVDWNNLRHHACTEIRAASLSGDCSRRREWGRHWYGFTKQHQVCARRRAIQSVRSNPACPDLAAAERAVDEVWSSCFSDTRPFDEIY